MSTEEAIKRMEQRATAAEQLISVLKQQVEEIKSSEINSSGYTAEILALKKENSGIRNEIEDWKKKLISAEASKGIKQIPVRNMSGPGIGNIDPNPDVQKSKTTTTSSSTNDDSTSVDSGKKASKKEKKPKDKKPEAEELPVHVGRLDMRVGHIISAKKHPDADSLYIEQIDVGEEKPRTVISGLVKFIPEDKMQNRMAIIMCNLKPSKMRGIMSEAMVMCASSPDKVEILTPPEGSKPGDLVYVEGFERNPDPQLNPKKKIFEACAPDLKTDDDKKAVYKGVPWTVNGKNVFSETLKNVQVK